MEVRGGGLTGLGYSYTSYGSAYVTKELLADIVIGRDAFGVEECWWSMLYAVRLLMDTDLTVEGLDSGCCGRAGSFGFKREQYDISALCGGLAVGRRRPRVDGLGMKWWKRHRRFRMRREVCHGFSTVP